MRLATFLKVVPLDTVLMVGIYIYLGGVQQKAGRGCVRGKDTGHGQVPSGVRDGKLLRLKGWLGGGEYCFVNISDRVFGKLQTKALRKLKKKLPSGVSGFLGPGPSSPRGLC